MAATSKKIPKKKRSVEKKSSGKSKRSLKSPLFSVLPFIIIALSLIVETCLILRESAGGVGTVIHALFFGLLGYASHVLVISAILISFFFGELMRKGTLRYKSIMAALLSIAAASFNSLIAENGMRDATLSFPKFFTSGRLGESGGVFGGVFGLIFSKIFSPTLAAVLLAIACVVLTTFALGNGRLGIWERLIGERASQDKRKPDAQKKTGTPEKPAFTGKAAVPDIDVSASRIETVIGQNESVSYPELDEGSADAYKGNLDIASDINDFSVSDGKHTIETVDFGKSEQTATPYKPEDLMQKFGFKESQPVKTDVYSEPTATKPAQPQRKINVSGARSYSPFASVVSEEEFFAQAHSEPEAPATPVGQTRAYSPFSDPLRSMNEPKREPEHPAMPQTYIANDAEQIWESMQKQADDLTQSAEQEEEPNSIDESAFVSAPAFEPTPVYTEVKEDYAVPEEIYGEDEEDGPQTYDEQYKSEPQYADEPDEPKTTVHDISALNKTGSSDFDEGISEPEQVAPVIAPKPAFVPQRPAPVMKQEDEDHSINPFGVYNKPRYPRYLLPGTDLLDAADGTVGISENEIYDTQRKLIDILESFGINATLTGYSVGPTITRYELTPGAGVKFKQIANLSEDISVRLQSDKLKSSIRIVTVPGKSVIGVEVPNSVVKKVALRSMIEEPTFRNAKSKITVCVGLSVSGKPVYMNIDDMPHVLVAGQTKSGKSVAINCMIMSLIYRATPDEVQLLLIDPKRVELSIYNNLPHLVMPVIDDPKRAAAALKWAVDEMDRRYTLLNEAQVRNRDEYYACRADNPNFEYMPQIVIIIDELADLMLQAKEHVEGRINRLAAMARACGMHIVIGTQRPSVDVVTGLIKANIPSHIAFKVSSQTDSRVILNVIGAEKLLGRGDMLYHETGKDIVRLQGAFVDTPEIKRVLNFIIDNNGKAVYNPEIMYALQQETDKLNKSEKKSSDEDFATDCSDVDFELLCQATELVIQMGGGISKNVIQRHLKIGFNRSANIFDKLEELGFISPPQGNKPRDCTVTWEQYQQWRNNNGR